jgi:RimJ/RimL family protein N-acetyltransferase
MWRPKDIEMEPGGISAKTVLFEAGGYAVRALSPDDASESWARWLMDPQAAAMLNAAPRAMTKAEIAAYIATFDQRENLLLGVFDKKSGQHFGIVTIAADYAKGRGLVNLLIGEAAYRNKGVLNLLEPYFAEWFFVGLGLQTMLATALGRNQIAIGALLKHGWQVDRVLPQHTVSREDGTKLDLYLMSFSRDAWRARRKGPNA